MSSAIDLRFGYWQVACADLSEVDLLCTDPPFSARTHKGMCPSSTDARWQRSTVNFDAWTHQDAANFIHCWAPRVRGWIVIITDHILWPTLTVSLASAGRYVFPPLPFVELGKQPRLASDGPASWTSWICVARPKSQEFARWASLPGAYARPVVHEPGEPKIKGGKPLWLMRALVRDYSRVGDLVCDPFAGAGTTLLAAAQEHRRAVGSEALEEHYNKAKRRLERGYTPTLFAEQSAADLTLI